MLSQCFLIYNKYLTLYGRILCSGSIKKLFFMSALVVSALSADSDKPKVEILTEATFVREDGYNFAYKTSDGVSRQEEAQLIQVGENKGIAVKGSYSYIGPDGQEYQVTFTADDKGYKPQIRVIPQGSQ